MDRSRGLQEMKGELFLFVFLGHHKPEEKHWEWTPYKPFNSLTLPAKSKILRVHYTYANKWSPIHIDQLTGIQLFFKICVSLLSCHLGLFQATLEASPNQHHPRRTSCGSRSKRRKLKRWCARPTSGRGKIRSVSLRSEAIGGLVVVYRCSQSILIFFLGGLLRVKPQTTSLQEFSQKTVGRRGNPWKQSPQSWNMLFLFRCS